MTVARPRRGRFRTSADGSSDPDLYFTIPHLGGYPAVLVLLDEIGVDELEDLVVEAWLDRAPKRLAAAYLADHPPARR